MSRRTINNRERMDRSREIALSQVIQNTPNTVSVYMLSHREKNVLRWYGLFYSLFLPVIAIVAGIVIWHPIGWLWSVVAAGVVYVVGMLAVVKLTRTVRSSTSEEDAIALQDRVLGLNKEPPKNWYIWPF